jgi:ketosteroid isomerase-like protein
MRAPAIGILVTVLAACAAHRAPRPVSAPPGTAGTPEAADRLFGERMNAGDLDGLVALYEKGATLVRENRTQTTGLDAIRTELGGILTAKPHVVLNVKTISRGGGNVALLYNDWHGSATEPGGKTVPINGCAIEVVRRQPDGRWLFVIDDPDGRGCRRRRNGSP